MKKLVINFLLCIFAFATYYGLGDGYAWKTTASGQKMNPNKMTCASWKYPLGTKLLVSTKHKGVYVVVNDRGGYCDVDLSPAAFKALAPLSRGKIKVNIMICD